MWYIVGHVTHGNYKAAHSSTNEFMTTPLAMERWVTTDIVHCWVDDKLRTSHVKPLQLY